VYTPKVEKWTIYDKKGIEARKLSAHANILEPVRPAVLHVEEGFAVGEQAGLAALTLGRIGAVEEGDVLIADIAEPNDS
jgi:hypothetical protein